MKVGDGGVKYVALYHNSDSGIHGNSMTQTAFIYTWGERDDFITFAAMTARVNTRHTMRVLHHKIYTYVKKKIDIKL